MLIDIPVGRPLSSTSIPGYPNITFTQNRTYEKFGTTYPEHSMYGHVELKIKPKTFPASLRALAQKPQGSCPKQL